MPTPNNEDAREAWVLRAGAELWKAVVAEADFPAEDTQEALAAVRAALDCARRLRCCSLEIEKKEHSRLSEECERAADVQIFALRQWGRGRGLRWDADWGTQWGEALLPAPTKDVSCLQECVEHECAEPVKRAPLRFPESARRFSDRPPTVP